MRHPSCPRSWEAEALLDGRLGADDRQSFNRHRQLCDTCTRTALSLENLASLFREMAPPPSTPLEHRRRRAALLRMANERCVHPRIHKNVRRASAVFVATVMVGTLAIAWGAVGLRSGIGSWVSHASQPIPMRDVTETSAPRPDEIPLQVGAPIVSLPPASHANLSRAQSSAKVGPSSADRVSQLSTERGASAFEAAMGAFRRSEWRHAETLFAQFIDERDRPERTKVTDPRAEDAWFLRALCHAKLGEPVRASDVIHRYLARFPGGLRVLDAGRLLKSFDRLDEAGRGYAQILRGYAQKLSEPAGLPIGTSVPDRLPSGEDSQATRAK